MSGFVAGLVHPLALPAHVLALLALGLLIGQQTAGTRHVSLAAFAAGVAVGLTAISFGVGETPAADVLLAAAFASGASAAIAHPLPTLACALLAAIAGVALALEWNWARLGGRILSSWIAASAILVLAVRFVRGQMF
jgi:urease accessory protein